MTSRRCRDDAILVSTKSWELHSKANLRLIDGRQLVDLIFAHYEQFDSRYKGLLPLRQTYVPSPADEE